MFHNFEILEKCWNVCRQINTFFVVLDDVQPLNTLEDRLEELKQHLLSEHFTLGDDVADVVGGLRVW